jgi:hypothetical protein
MFLIFLRCKSVYFNKEEEGCEYNDLVLPNYNFLV